MARPREFDEDRVLDAVMETFWTRGYEGTSAQNLVDATGLGRGSLYAAFSNKDGLFEQAVLRYNRQSHENVERLQAPGSALKRLRELLIDFVDADLKGSDKRGCLATNTAIELGGRDPHVAELVRQNFKIMIGGIREAIARGQEAGETRTDIDAESLALFVFNAIQGLRVLAKVMPPSYRAKLISIIDRTLEALT